LFLPRSMARIGLPVVVVFIVQAPWGDGQPREVAVDASVDGT
jgi:hypothetical protein